MKIPSLRPVPLLALAIAAALSVFDMTAAENGKLKVGDKAPSIEGKDQDGKTWKLADETGKKIVLLYFYPRDDTPGCTKEACGFRDDLDELKKENVDVIGVSFDSSDSHQKFISKYNLNFPLLADTDGKIADAYGAKMANGKMAKRVSFLIGKDGKIEHITDSPNAATHLTEMKEAVEKLKKG
jgi:peroxiredoxin Q/BCP